jgi:hypothetical protein
VTECDRIADQIQRSLNGPAWHGPAVAELLHGLSVEAASARPIPDGHNIWELVLHLTTWCDAVHQRLQGRIRKPTDAEDWPAIADTSMEAWNRDVQKLKQVHRDLIEMLSLYPEDELHQTAAGEDYSNYFMLHGLAQHNIYHAGQMALLKKRSAD